MKAHLIRTEVAAVLMDIEANLRQLLLWDAEPPSAEALASEQPFAIDTLTLPQWLQWIFLPTMYRLLESETPLPPKCGITPMAEEYFRGNSLPVRGLLEALAQVDKLLSRLDPDDSVRDPSDSH